MSPSRICSTGKVLMIEPTAGINVPRCMAMAQACARVVPSSVNRLAEASSPSLTIGEQELFSSVSCISSAILSRRWRITSSVIGSKRSAAVPAEAMRVMVVSSSTGVSRRPAPRPSSLAAEVSSKSACSMMAGPARVSALASSARSWIGVSSQLASPGKSTRRRPFCETPAFCGGSAPTGTAGRRARCMTRRLTILAGAPVLWPLRRSCAVSKAW